MLGFFDCKYCVILCQILFVFLILKDGEEVFIIVNYCVLFDIQNLEGVLLLGMMVQVFFVIEVVLDVLFVFIVVLDDDGSLCVMVKGILECCRFEIGMCICVFVEICSGLVEGEVVIIVEWCDDVFLVLWIVL